MSNLEDPRILELRRMRKKSAWEAVKTQPTAARQREIDRRAACQTWGCVNRVGIVVFIKQTVIFQNQPRDY